MEKSRFFNSVSGDRKYLAEDFASYFSNILSNGVFLHEATALKVTPSSGISVAVAAGKAYINGYCYENTTTLTKTFETVVDNRIDRIAVRLDMINRTITVVIKKGTATSTPSAPALVRNSDTWELGIADVYLAAGTTIVTAAMVTDLRANSTYCGGVTMTVDRDEILGDITETIAEFTQASSRININSGETAAVIFGKIKKFFADLKALAFISSVGTEQINDLAVSTAKLANLAVTTSKIAASAVTTEKISDASITNIKIAANAEIAQSKISGLSASFAACDKKETLYSGTAALLTNGSTLTMSASPSSGDTIEIHYTVDGGRGNITFVKRIEISSGFSLADVAGGSSSSSGFTATNYYFTWNNGNVLTMANKYYLLNFANNGGTLLENCGAITIKKIYKIA